MRDHHQIAAKLLGLAALSVTSACGLLFRFDDGGSGGSANGGASVASNMGGATSTTTASGGQGGNGDPCAPLVDNGTCGDVTSDPQNCGGCGHDCLGGDCVDGRCQLIPFLSPATGTFTNIVIRNGRIWIGLTNDAVLYADLSKLGPSEIENNNSLSSIVVSDSVTRIAADDNSAFVAYALGTSAIDHVAVDLNETLGSVSGVFDLSIAGDFLVVLTDGQVLRLDRTGANQTAQVLGSSQANQYLATTNTQAFWYSKPAEAIYFVDVAFANEVSTFATAQEDVSTLAIDDRNTVYWAANSGEYRLRRKAQGMAQPIDVTADLAASPTALAFQCEDAYIAQGDSILSVNRDATGATPELAFAVPAGGVIRQLVAVDGALYVIKESGVFRGVITP
jgi:hypothetical protein